MFTSAPSPVFRGLAAAVLTLLLAVAPLRAASALEPNEFDPAEFDSLLFIYVNHDGVDYAAWKADGTGALDEFLDRAADYDLTSTIGKEPRGAFLINAYNAWAIRMVLEHYPVESLLDIPGFFDKNPVRIAGEERTLNDMETRLGEIMTYLPGFAFTLAPGAVGMPELRKRAYTSDDLHERINNVTTDYLRECGCLSYDRENNVVHLPPQFQTHWALFEKQPRGIVGFLANHMALADVMAITRNKPSYEFGTIDWTLRDGSGDSAKDEDAGGDGGR